MNDAPMSREGLLESALREMLELREATQAGRLTEKHELDIVRDARAALACPPAADSMSREGLRAVLSDAAIVVAWEAMADALDASLDDDLTGQRVVQLRRRASELRARAALASPPAAVGRDALCGMYASAYRSGHADTVEGCYTDVHPSDWDSYFADAVDEFLTERIAPRPEADDARAVEAVPNWCRTCGKRPNDPLSVFCGDAFHLTRPSAAPEPARSGEDYNDA